MTKKQIIGGFLAAILCGFAIIGLSSLLEGATLNDHVPAEKGSLTRATAPFSYLMRSQAKR